MLRTRSPRKEKISNCYLHSNSLSNKMDNSLLAVRDINHKYIVVEGKKEVLSITVGDNESSKYWLSVLNELKKRLDWLWIVLLKNGPQNTRIL